MLIPISLRYYLLIILLSLPCASKALTKQVFNYANHYGISASYFSVYDPYKATEQDMQINSYGNALGFFYHGTVTEQTLFGFGLDFVVIKDNAPFSQTVKNTITGEVSDKKSDITGSSAYIEFGAQYAFFAKQALRIGLFSGYRYNNISRTITRCNTCQEQLLPAFKSSFYLKPFINYQFNEYLAIKLTYSHYFTKSGFSDSISIDISCLSF